MPLPIYKLDDDAGRTGYATRLRDLRDTVATDSPAAETVRAILRDVRERGDDAVAEYMRKWTDPGFTVDRIVVTETELDAATARIDPALRADLERAIEHVAAYQSHLKPADLEPMTLDGAELGLRWTPMRRVGLAVPGGTAAYPSSVVMLAVPARVAGVPEQGLAVVSPPPTIVGAAASPSPDDRPDVPDLVLAACRLAGVAKVYRIGGAQAMAALAYGTQTVEPVDFIAGPGNVYVQLAKQQLMGTVGIDGFLGPSEIVTIADRTARAEWIAADLIAQAEHDPGKCFLVAWEPEVIEAVVEAIRRQLPERGRRAAIEAALADASCALLARDEVEAAAVASELAPEHLNLAVADPDAWLPRIDSAGEIFLGDATPVASGDYWAGPSHSLPTGTTARFASGISALTFMKRTGLVAYRQGMPGDAADAIARLARAEGLDGHAASVNVRRDRRQSG